MKVGGPLGHRVQIDTRHMEAQTRAFDKRRAAPHEAVEHFQMLEISGRLMVSCIPGTNPRLWPPSRKTVPFLTHMTFTLLWAAAT